MPIEKIQKLRKVTGIGILNCKKALIKSKGDFDLAIEILRKMGKKISQKHSLKNTKIKEGTIFIKINKEKNCGVIILLACETDFVCKNELFQNMGEKIANSALQYLPKNISGIKKIKINKKKINSNITSLINKLGEKIEIQDYKKIIKGKLIISYLHNNNKIGVLLELNKIKHNSIEEVGKNVAMQIAAMNPIAVDKKNIKEKIIKKEIEIIKNTIDKNKNKKITEKIIKNKIDKFYEENVLLNQKFVKDNSINISEYIKNINEKIKIKKFEKIKLN